MTSYSFKPIMVVVNWYSTISYNVFLVISILDHHWASHIIPQVFRVKKLYEAQYLLVWMNLNASHICQIISHYSQISCQNNQKTRTDILYESLIIINFLLKNLQDNNYFFLCND
jgi:hypothetical protein